MSGSRIARGLTSLFFVLLGMPVALWAQNDNGGNARGLVPIPTLDALGLAALAGALATVGTYLAVRKRSGRK